MPKRRVAIVLNDGKWYARRVAYVIHDLDRDEMVYRCDKSLGGPYRNLLDVPEVRAFLKADRNRDVRRFHRMTKRI